MASNSFAFNHARGRTADYTYTLYEADGSTGVALAASDVVRFKLYSGNNATPILDIASGQSPTDAGSSVTITQISSPAQARIRIAQGDVSSLALGAYDAEIIVVDDSLTSPIDGALSAERGVVNIMASGGGNIDKSS